MSRAIYTTGASLNDSHALVLKKVQDFKPNYFDRVRVGRNTKSNGVHRTVILIDFATDFAERAWGAQPMKSKLDLSSLSMDELWALHEEVGSVLSAKIRAEKRELEKRLAKLNSGSFEKAKIDHAALNVGERRVGRRKYPPVLPKFRNPNDPSETWAGRGKQPRWLVSQLKAGKKINDFLIDRAKRNRSNPR